MERIINKAKATTLSEQEKAESLKMIEAFVDKNPIQNLHFETEQKSVKSPYSILFITGKFNAFTKRPLVTVLAVLVLLTGSGALASQNSIPGDILYPLKVNVREPVESAFALGTTAEVYVETKHANARLVEAERLVATKKLDDKTRLLLATNFEKHTKKINDKIEKIRNSGKEEIALSASADFEGSLSAHKVLIAGLLRSSSDDDDKNEDLEDFKNLLDDNLIAISNNNRSRVNSTLSVMVNSEDDDNSDDDNEKSDEIVKNTEQKIERTLKFIKENKGGAEANVKAEADIKIALDYFEEGKLKLKKGLKSEAYQLFARASVLAEQIKVTLYSQNVIESSLNHSLDLDFEEKRSTDDDDREDSENESSQNDNEESNKEVDSGSEQEITIKLDSLLK